MYIYICLGNDANLKYNIMKTLKLRREQLSTIKKELKRSADVYSFMKQFKISGKLSYNKGFVLTHKKEIDCKIFSNAVIETITPIVRNNDMYFYLSVDRNGVLGLYIH